MADLAGSAIPKATGSICGSRRNDYLERRPMPQEVPSLFFSLTAAAVVAGLSTRGIAASDQAKPYGLAARPEANPWLSLPPPAAGPVPTLLAPTRAFKD